MSKTATTAEITGRLSHFFETWLSRVTKHAPMAADLLRKHSYITGGAIASLYHGDTPKDIDVVVTDLSVLHRICRSFRTPITQKMKQCWGVEIVMAGQREVITKGDLLDFTQHDDDLEGAVILPVWRTLTDLPVLKMTLLRPKINGVPPDFVIQGTDKDDGGIPFVVTPRALTFSTEPSTQILLRFIGEPEEVWSTFHFYHAMAGWRPTEPNRLIGHEESGELIAKKVLKPNIHSRHPLHTLFAVTKFRQRGWTVAEDDVYAMVKRAADACIEHPEHVMAVSFSGKGSNGGDS